MSDFIGHYCGIAVVRLRQPLSYYRERYGNFAWGLDKLQLLMIKQRNRGQDGAGIAVAKLAMPPGQPYLLRRRSIRPEAVDDIFGEIRQSLGSISSPALADLDDLELKRRYEFIAEVYLGHLRYGTHGEHGINACHPHVRQSNWKTRNLVLAGNFNMTNSGELLDKLVSYGQHPVGLSDTAIVLEKIGHFLDLENDRIAGELAHDHPDLCGPARIARIAELIDLPDVLRKASKHWDGGYALAGMLGSGDAFVCRDPHGIRPAFAYVDDEVAAVASERAALTSVFNVEAEQVRPIAPGHAFIVRSDGEISEREFQAPGDERSCSFERIYFSRGNDPEIYRERKALGANLAARTVAAVDGDLEHSVLSFIPNTAETAFLGLVDETRRLLRMRQAESIWALHEAGTLTRAQLHEYVETMIRVEKSAHKDQKIRTFIAQDRLRSDLVSHVYDITRETVGPEDNLIVLDDSIVRGTTLRESIVTMLSRLHPKRIVIVSSAPPICYPDCYGIDMSELGRFIAFQATIAVLRDQGRHDLIDEVREACEAQAERPADQLENHVRRLYDAVSIEALSDKVAELIRPPDLPWPGTLRVVYQTIEGLREAIPDHRGDWYFTGDYPTPGGLKVLNRAFLNWSANRTGRSYE